MENADEATLNYPRSRPMMEAAGIEPASSELGDDSEGESDLAGPDAGRIASESGHKDDDLRSQRGPSEERPGGAGDEPSG